VKRKGYRFFIHLFSAMRRPLWLLLAPVGAALLLPATALNFRVQPTEKPALVGAPFKDSTIKVLNTSSDEITAQVTKVLNSTSHELETLIKDVVEQTVAAAVAASKIASNQTNATSNKTVIVKELPAREKSKRLGKNEPLWKAILVVIIMAIMLVLLYSEALAPHLTLLLALVSFWTLTIVKAEDALKGFSNEALVTVGSLFVVVKAVDKAKVIGRVSHYCLGERTSMQMALIRFCLLVFFLGGFMSNTPLVAIMMPIIRDWARKMNYAPSKFLLPMAYPASLAA
jgi:Na+/H+ antiporter NhaD/arsenite permease-like protein